MDKQDWRERHSYHKVSSRRPEKSQSGRRIGFLLLPMFIVLYFFNSRMYVDRVKQKQEAPPPSSVSAQSIASSVPAVSSSQPASSSFDESAMREDVRMIITNIADNKWGQETMDKVVLIADELEAVYPDFDRAVYTVKLLRALHSGQGGEELTDEMLTQAAMFIGEVSENGVPPVVLERYRLALKNTAIK